MRTIEIRAGKIDVRLSPDRTAVCLVFSALDMDVRLFRTMPLPEAIAFAAHLQQQLKAAANE